MKHIPLIIALSCATVNCWAEQPGSALTPRLRTEPNRYRIGSGDVIEIRFRLTPEFNQSVTVQPDGFVSLEIGGELHLGGLTVEEAEGKVAIAAASRLREPEVKLVLKEFVKPQFTVGGEVNHPGMFELRGEISAAQAIAIAGGFKESAKHSQVALVRRVNNEWAEVSLLNLKQMINSAHLQEDSFLQPGDMLLVPQNKLSRMERLIRWSNLAVYGLAVWHP